MTAPKDRFKIPALYKKLLALAIVIGPIYWLMFTEDGRRRTDLVVLSLKGDPFVALRLDILGPQANEQAIREFLPRLTWECDDAPSAFGEHHCLAPIGAFNDAPAHYLLTYFDQGGLSAMKVVYRSPYHDWLVGLNRSMLGDPGPPLQGVLRWKTERGLVLMQARPDPDREEPSLLWLSAELAARLGG
jgi:hypothetical protein